MIYFLFPTASKTLHDEERGEGGSDIKEVPPRVIREIDGILRLDTYENCVRHHDKSEEHLKQGHSSEV